MQDHIPYLQPRPGKRLPDGSRAVRWFWEPSRAMRLAGFATRRLSDDRALAIEQARALNQQVEAWRQGQAAEAASLQEKRQLRVVASGGRTGKLVARGSVDHLIADYRASDKFAKLAPRTRADYEIYLDKIAFWAGPDPVANLTPLDVQKLYRPYVERGNIATGNALIRVLRLLLGHGRRHNFCAGNAASEPDLEANQKGGLIWPRAATLSFAAQADKMGWHSVGTFILTNEWCGLRPADMLRAPRQILRGEAAALIPAKTARRTGNEATLPIDLVPALVARLREEGERQKARGVIAPVALVNEATGKPWLVATLSHVFAEIRDKLAKKTPRFELDPGLKMDGAGADQEGRRWVATADLQLRFLRHTAVTRLAEAGASREAIAAITGLSLKSIEAILEHYLARTAPLARAAFQARVDAEAATEKSAKAEAQKGNGDGQS